MNRGTRPLAPPSPPLAMDAPALLDSMQQGVYVTDLQRRIVYWNRAAERITGWKAQDILGRCCYDNVLCHIDKDGRHLCGEEFCPLHRSIITGQSSTVPVIVFAQNPQGQRVPMRVSVAPLRDEGGGVVGGVETFQDLSSEFCDMQRGRRIQATSMSNEAADDPRLQVRVHYAPHDIIGGDYYSISRLAVQGDPEARRYGFFLGDVSGHGLSAALYTMHLGSLWHDHQGLAGQPAELAGVINRRLHELLHDASAFATAVCGVMEPSDGSLQIVSAGGPSPQLFHADGRCEVLEMTGQPLGIFEDGEFGQQQVRLEAGDRLLLFTDGAFEISRSDGEQLGETGLTAILRAMGYPARELDFGELEKRLLEYSDRIRFDDDLTIIEIARR